MMYNRQDNKTEETKPMDILQIIDEIAPLQFPELVEQSEVEVIYDRKTSDVVATFLLMALSEKSKNKRRLTVN